VGNGFGYCLSANIRRLAHQIAERGLLFFPNSALAHHPRQANFPRRNHDLISGIKAWLFGRVEAIVVASMITARLANRTGREVFAIPGFHHSPVSKAVIL